MCSPTIERRMRESWFFGGRARGGPPGSPARSPNLANDAHEHSHEAEIGRSAYAACSGARGVAGVKKADNGIAQKKLTDSPLVSAIVGKCEQRGIAPVYEASVTLLSKHPGVPGRSGGFGAIGGVGGAAGTKACVHFSQHA